MIKINPHNPGNPNKVSEVGQFPPANAINRYVAAHSLEQCNEVFTALLCETASFDGPLPEMVMAWKLATKARAVFSKDLLIAYYRSPEGMMKKALHSTDLEKLEIIKANCPKEFETLGLSGTYQGGCAALEALEEKCIEALPLLSGISNGCIDDCELTGHCFLGNDSL